METKIYILTYPTGHCVGLDSNSGGYPYQADNISSAKLWTSLKAAQDYAKMFPELVIKELHYTTSDLED